MVQIDGTRRRVYINFTDISYVIDMLQTTNGTTLCKRASGEISSVRLKIAGMGTRRLRIRNLPPEITGVPYEQPFPRMEKSNPYRMRPVLKHIAKLFLMELK